MHDVLACDFDDLVVGERSSTPARMVTEADVAAFAALTGDTHPAHTDAAWAARGPFGERVAHGMLVLSCALGLVAFDPERVLALRRVADAVFKRPVALGDTIHAGVRVDRVAALGPDTGLVAVAVDVRNQHERLVARATIEVLWRRAQASAAGADAGTSDRS